MRRSARARSSMGCQGTDVPVRARRALSLLLALLTMAPLAGCGSDERRPQSLSVALDFTPNPVHAPIYAAVRERHDRAEGVRIRIRPPGSRPDSLKLLTAGRG